MPGNPRTPPERLPHRPCDSLEDAAFWLLAVAALTLVVVAGAVGFAVGGAASARAQLQAAERAPVAATVLADAPFIAAAPEGSAPRVFVDVTWTGADGVQRTGQALVPCTARAGQPVTIWLDRAGRPIAEPVTQAAAVVAAVTIGVAVLVLGVVVLAAVWAGVRRWVAVLNDRAWDREWATVGPDWTGHGRRDAGRKD